MAQNSSATPREETRGDAETKGHGDAETECLPRQDKSVRASRSGADETSAIPVHIDASLKRRARLLITNSAIPRQTRSLIRYALVIKDPYLAQVVQRVEAGEMTIDCLHRE